MLAVSCEVVENR